MKNTILLLFIAINILSAKDKNIMRYIDEYQYIAISEMERTGVPASIKLAQGILESNAGRSVLARRAKNHFGIKCGGHWKGKKYYRKDDDYKRGKLVKSCFRVYKNAEVSYLAHSDFLLDNTRYRSLFKLDPTNYKKWAKGLKKAGYATSRTYDKKLIKLIEQYDLHQYDKMVGSDMVAKAKTLTKIKREVFYINDAKMTYAKAGETPAAIAQRTKTALERILNYNEQLTAANQVLPADAKVFLQSKRKNFRGKKRTHTVQAGETMYAISQTYGLRLEKLYKKNKMNMGEQPATGATITVRGKARKRPELRDTVLTPPPPPVRIDTKEEVDKEEKEKEISSFEPVLTPTDRPVITPPVVPPAVEPSVEAPSAPVITPPQIETRRYHTVAKGETLWRISRYYGTTVEEIQRLNNLNTKIIQVGMRLRVE